MVRTRRSAVAAALAAGASVLVVGCHGVLKLVGSSPALRSNAPRLATAYADNPELRKLASEVPYALLVPASVPDSPPVTMAQVVPQPPLVPHPAGQIVCQIDFAGVLNVNEWNKDHVDTRGVPAKQVVTINTASRVHGVLVPGSAENGVADHVLRFEEDGVVVQLDSTALSNGQLIALARTMIRLKPSRGGRG